MFVKTLYSNFVDVEGFYFLQGVSTVFVKQVGDYSIYYQSFIFLKKKERDYLLKMIVDLIWL